MVEVKKSQRFGGRKLRRVPEAILVVSLGAALLGGCTSSRGSRSNADSEPALTVAVAPVKRMNLTRELVLAAEFRPFQEIDVHAKVAGFVKTINVDVGDRVRAGQLLATLEIPELHDEVMQAEAAARQSEEEINRAQSDLERSESGHEMAHLAYTRLAEVLKSQPNLVAQQEIDDAQGRDRMAEAQMASARASLAAARQQLQVARANQDKLRTLFAYARITAPFAGVITKRYADTGAMIQAGTASQSQAMPLVRLSQNDLLRLIIPVPESAVPQIHLGSPVQVRVPSIGKAFRGIVARFSDRVDSDTRTMHTEVDVLNPRLELVPGMYSYTSLGLESKHDALAIPVQAVSRTNDRVTVYAVSRDHKIEERAVTIGIETSDEVEILSGLQLQDLVVMGSRTQLRPGQTIQPKIVEWAPAAGEK
jgi:RND family efflux transporter MFP subunit